MQLCDLLDWFAGLSFAHRCLMLPLCHLWESTVQYWGGNELDDGCTLNVSSKVDASLSYLRGGLDLRG